MPSCAFGLLVWMRLCPHYADICILMPICAYDLPLCLNHPGWGSERKPTEFVRYLKSTDFLPVTMRQMNGRSRDTKNQSHCPSHGLCHGKDAQSDSENRCSEIFVDLGVEPLKWVCAEWLGSSLMGSVVQVVRPAGVAGSLSPLQVNH